MTDNDRHFVTALARGLAVLRCFTTAKRELGTSEIARLLKLPQPTVWRLCKTLQDEGYLLTGQNGDKLQLSPSVLGLGYSALAAAPLSDIARPAMQEIANRFGAACSMGMRHGLQIVLTQRCQGQSELVLNLHVGSQFPLANTAMGAAHIARMREEDRTMLLEQIRVADPDNWPAREALISGALRQFAEQGFIVDSGDFHPRINAAAIAFVASDGQIYSLSCGAPSEQIKVDTLRNEIGPALAVLAKALSPQR
ncbi:transcriptional regulator, IclR family [Burkholderia sp. WP9]|uniref:IclR family transcriptional regulator n=1 Tax=Burkholderia sp. WP9 TaxID=1500263 RepID=UPI00089ABEE8|nr:IclR family transcriptional regulator [Burkholderia sp. WP9]SEF13813.1 transcriptional regulator, IclR family [Burkholderia sp. WP9]